MKGPRHLMLLSKRTTLLQNKNAADGNVESFAKGAAKAGARGIGAAIAEELLDAAIGGEAM